MASPSSTLVKAWLSELSHSKQGTLPLEDWFCYPWPSSATYHLRSNESCKGRIRIFQVEQVNMSTEFLFLPDTNDDPNYYASKPETLVTSSDPVSFSLGTGSEILSSVLHSCESTVHELIIVTCFWATSSSQAAIKSLLLKLSHNARTRRPGLPIRKIRVRICLSSVSISQKLFHTTSLNGHIYPQESWPKLGLPASHELGGVDLVVKSIFIRPFSVTHPKFILMDRERAWFPSCNVSWEEWFEGCVELRGGITSKLYDFWNAFWGREGGGMTLPGSLFSTSDTGRGEFGEINLGGPAVPTRTRSGLLGRIDLPPSATQTLLLPSPHHRNPRFGFLSTVQAPSTPLNVFILVLMATATRSIWMQTPNLTCSPVIVSHASQFSDGRIIPASPRSRGSLVTACDQNPSIEE
jgi:hypothetical protein